jgi:cytochrome c oxidase assembly factor CtaG
MTGWGLFISTWEWHPSVIIGCVLLIALYFGVIRGRAEKNAAFFVTGVALMFLALVSPLDTLGDDYLFSAHMLQHILLNMVAPPLFVLGVPAWLMQRMLQRPPVSALERVLGYPVVAWGLGSGTLLVWHVPALFDATLENENIHIFEHLTFLVTGTILWWPVFARIDARRLAPMRSALYLLLASMPNALLGIYLTFCRTPLYAGYLHPADEHGALSLIRDRWGLDPLTDQQLGGAFMWVIGSAIYLWAILVMVARWYRQPEAGSDDQRGAP